MSSMVPEEYRLCSSKHQWSDPCISQCFSRTDHLWVGVWDTGCSPNMQPPFWISRLQLSTRLVRGLSVFCPEAYFQQHVRILALGWTGCSPPSSQSLGHWTSCDYVPAEASQSCHSRLFGSQLSRLRGFVISAIMMWASIKSWLCYGTTDLLDLIP